MSKENLSRLIESGIMMILMLIFIGMLSKPIEPATEIESPEIEVVDVSTNIPCPSCEYEDPHESEIIEETLIEQNYIREDIPLDSDTQLELRAACEEFDIPYELALAVIWQETNFKNTIGDNGNAYGYMQIWEYWHSERMARIGATDLMNPIDNFRTGCCILSENYERTGSYYDTLSIYNTGSSGWSPYADAVMEKWDSLTS